jgi:hypothetical protein
MCQGHSGDSDGSDLSADPTKSNPDVADATNRRRLFVRRQQSPMDVASDG